MFSLEIAATLLLLGAQVIAEYERVGQAGTKVPPTDKGAPPLAQHG